VSVLYARHGPCSGSKHFAPAGVGKHTLIDTFEQQLTTFYNPLVTDYSKVSIKLDTYWVHLLHCRTTTLSRQCGKRGRIVLGRLSIEGRGCSGSPPRETAPQGAAGANGIHHTGGWVGPQID
jgi:hypothetical protein